MYLLIERLRYLRIDINQNAVTVRVIERTDNFELARRTLHFNFSTSSISLLLTISTRYLFMSFTINQMIIVDSYSCVEFIF